MIFDLSFIKCKVLEVKYSGEFPGEPSPLMFCCGYPPPLKKIDGGLGCSIFLSISSV